MEICVTGFGAVIVIYLVLQGITSCKVQSVFAVIIGAFFLAVGCLALLILLGIVLAIRDENWIGASILTLMLAGGVLGACYDKIQQKLKNSVDKQ